jgi:hypothetical protein
MRENISSEHTIFVDNLARFYSEQGGSCSVFALVHVKGICSMILFVCHAALSWFIYTIS